MPQLHDPNFAHTLIYICEHTPKGAMGIMINKPLDVTIAHMLSHIGIEAPLSTALDQTIYSGGPVQAERGFVLHPADSSWEGTIPLSPELSLTTSRDILEAIADHKGPKQFSIALGYAGWDAGQLEEEIANNFWLSTPSKRDPIFNCPPEQRWHQAAQLLGIDLNLLSTLAGHA